MSNPRDTPRGQGALQPSFTGYTAPRTVAATSTPQQAALMGEPAPVPRTIPPRTGPSNNPVPASSAPATNTAVAGQLKRAGNSFSGLGGGGSGFQPNNFAAPGGAPADSPGGDYLTPAAIAIGALLLLALFLKR